MYYEPYDPREASMNEDLHRMRRDSRFRHAQADDENTLERVDSPTAMNVAKEFVALDKVVTMS